MTRFNAYLKDLYVIGRDINRPTLDHSLRLSVWCGLIDKVHWTPTLGLFTLGPTDVFSPQSDYKWEYVLYLGTTTDHYSKELKANHLITWTLYIERLYGDNFHSSVDVYLCLHSTN